MVYFLNDFMKNVSVETLAVVILLITLPSVTYANCETECTPAQSCATLLECRMAEIDCQQACRQRYVLEHLAVTLEKIAVSMTTHSVGNLSEKELLSQPEISPETPGSSFPQLGVPKKQGSMPFLQIDSGTTVITTDTTEE